jgi:hypothetical protein
MALHHRDAKHQKLDPSSDKPAERKFYLPDSRLTTAKQKRTSREGAKTQRKTEGFTAEDAKDAEEERKQAGMQDRALSAFFFLSLCLLRVLSVLGGESFCLCLPGRFRRWSLD